MSLATGITSAFQRVGTEFKTIRQLVSGVPSYGLPASAAPANRYDTIRGVYNYKSSNTRRLEQGISRAMVGGMTTHLVIGDSVSIGAIAQTGSAWAFDRLRAWPMAMRDQLMKIGIPGNGTGIIRHVDPSGLDPRWGSITGTWNGASGYTYTTVATSSATLISDRDGTAFDYWYYDSGLGTFTISVDGVVQKTVTTNGSAGWKAARITGQNILAGVTLIKITLTATNGGGLYAAGGTVWTPNGGLQVHNPSQCGSTASGTGLTAWADYTAGTGLGYIYDNVAGRARQVTNAASTAGSSTLTSATAAFTADDIGKPITQVPGASGPMFLGECYIGAILTGTTATIYSGVGAAAAPVLASNTTSSQTVNIGRDPDCVHIALGANDISALAASDATITAAITTIKGHFTNSDVILHLPHEVSTTLITTIRATAYQKAMYALADSLDVPLYDWRDRVGSYAAGQANGSYGDNMAHLTPATESDLGAQLAWIIGGGGGQAQSALAPVLPADLANKKYVDSLSAGGSPASETVAGIAEVATQSEVTTGTDDGRMVTPLKLATRLAGTKISALPAVSVLADADELAIVNGAATKGVTLSQLTAYFESRARVHNAAVATQVTGASDVYITNSGLAIPLGRLQAKSKARWDLAITKAGAGTGTPTFNIRFGTGNALGDTSRCLFTWPAANTAVADEMQVVIEATFRTVGSGTTTVIEGSLTANHELTTTGFGGTALTNVIILNTTGGGFDSTVAASFIGLSVNPGTAGAWSIRQCKAVLENLA